MQFHAIGRRITSPVECFNCANPKGICCFAFFSATNCAGGFLRNFFIESAVLPGRKRIYSFAAFFLILRFIRLRCYSQENLRVRMIFTFLSDYGRFPGKLQCPNWRQFKGTCALLPMMLLRAEEVPELKPDFPAFQQTKVNQAVDC